MREMKTKLVAYYTIILVSYLHKSCLETSKSFMNRLQELILNQVEVYSRNTSDY